MGPRRAPGGWNRRALMEGFCLLCLALALGWQALRSHVSGVPVGWELSPALFPLILAVLLALLSLALIREGFTRAPEGLPAARWLPVAVTTAAAAAYALLMPALGFALATACFLFFMMLFLGERRPLALALVPLGFSAGATLLFGRLLHVMLPASPLDVLRRALDALL